MTVFVEFSVSQGPGTLIEHGVKAVEFGSNFFAENDGDALFQATTEARYQEFLSIHGSERAV